MTQKTDLQIAAEKILADADTAIAAKGYYEKHTCNTYSYGWNKDDHQALLMPHRTAPKGYHIEYQISFGVHEWTITKVSSNTSPDT